MDRKHTLVERLALWMSASALVGAGIANCSNENHPGSPIAATCEDLMSIYCNRIAQCDPVGMRREFGDVAGCKTRQGLGCAALRLPGVTWPASKVQECAEQIRSAPTCYGKEAESGACRSLPGTFVDGTPCELASQCTSLWCRYNSIATPDGGRTDPPCGACYSTDAGVSGCGDAGACAADQRCVYPEPFRPGQCATLQREGAPCSAAAPCTNEFFCKRDTPDAGGPGICAQRGGKGAACAASYECNASAGLRCFGGRCDSPTFVAIGEPCDEAARQ
jgi:hypothetical protein